MNDLGFRQWNTKGWARPRRRDRYALVYVVCHALRTIKLLLYVALGLVLIAGLGWALLNYLDAVFAGMLVVTVALVVLSCWWLAE